MGQIEAVVHGEWDTGIDDHKDLSVELPGGGGDGTRTAQGTAKAGRTTVDPKELCEAGH